MLRGTRGGRLSAALVVAVANLGCAESTVRSAVSYGDSARAAYKKGLVELKDENYPEALKYFSFVKNK